MSWNGSKGGGTSHAPRRQAPRASAGRPSPFRGLIAGAVVVALAVAAYFAFFSRDEIPQRGDEVAKGHGRIREVKPAAAPKPAPEPERPRSKKKLEDMSPEERREMRLQHIAEAQARMKDIPLARPPETNLVFKTATDQILAMVADLADGKDMPPLPIDRNFEREFVASLKEPIVIDDGDSEKVKNLKSKVAQLRRELDERASHGEPMVRILKDFQREMAADYKMRDELRLDVRKMIETDGREAAQKYCDKVNESLRQLGIKEIDMPMTQEECEAWGEQFLKEREAEAAARKTQGGTTK